MLHEVGKLVKALHEAARTMTLTQVDFAEAGRNLNELSSTYTSRLTQLSDDIDEIKSLLRHGFRLSHDE
jgi:hypothetical protein